MRHAVLAACLAFTPQLRIRQVFVPAATRRIARIVLHALDRRRSAIDDAPMR